MVDAYFVGHLVLEKMSKVSKTSFLLSCVEHCKPNTIAMGMCRVGANLDRKRHQLLLSKTLPSVFTGV